MIYKINGKEIEFDIYDLDASAKIENGITNLDKDEKQALKTLKDGKLKDGVQALYSAYRNFFIAVTGIDVVDGCNNAMKAQKMAVDFVNQIKTSSVKKVSAN